MVSKAEEGQFSKRLFKALDNAIEKGPWDEGLIFQNTGNKLRTLRDKLKKR